MSGVLAWAGVAVLGAAGAYARFAVGTWVGARGAFPMGTFVVNLTGAFALGLLTGLSLTGDALLVLGTGLLGAYTTFSTWMVEAQRLAEEAEFVAMTAYLVLSMVAGLAVAGLGWAIGGAVS
jgi:fluoride exporter